MNHKLFITFINKSGFEKEANLFIFKYLHAKHLIQRRVTFETYSPETKITLQGWAATVNPSP